MQKKLEFKCKQITLGAELNCKVLPKELKRVLGNWVRVRVSHNLCCEATQQL